MRRKYQYLVGSIFGMLGLALACCILRNIFAGLNWVFLLSQIGLTIIFIMVLSRLFFRTNLPFDLEQVQALWKRMGKLLRVPAPVLITLINISPLLIYGIIKLIIQPIMMLYGHHVNFGFGLYNASAGQNQVFFLYLGIGFGLMLLSTCSNELIFTSHGRTNARAGSGNSSHH